MVVGSAILGQGHDQGHCRRLLHGLQDVLHPVVGLDDDLDWLVGVRYPYRPVRFAPVRRTGPAQQTVPDAY